MLGKRFLGFVIMMDGLLTAIFDHSFIRLVRVGPKNSLVWRVADFFLEIPPWLLRIGALMQARMGYKMWKGE
jgi:hypothetical protein